MEKIKVTSIKLKFDNPELKKVKHEGNIIEIRPWMTVPEQILLINHYCKNLFMPEDSRKFIDGSEHDIFGAEINLINEVLRLYTNIDVSMEEGGDPALDLDGFLASGLWKEIKKNIENYGEFEERLLQTVSDTREQINLQKSVGASVDHVAAKISSFVDSLNSFLEKVSGFSPNDIEKMKSAGKEMLEDIRKSDVAQIFKEAEMQNNPVAPVLTKEVPEPAPKTTRRGRRKKTDLVQ